MSCASLLRIKDAAVSASGLDPAQCRRASRAENAAIATGRRPAMTVNVGMIDRIVRVVLGLALIAFALGYIYPGTGWNWAGWLGVVPLLTAAFGTCPAYSLLGVTTCSAERS
jgi:Protein of unknown function (DUF2892)